MRRKSSKLNPSKAKGSLLMAKTKKQKKKINNGVWLLVLAAFVIALLALLRSKGYFG